MEQEGEEAVAMADPGLVAQFDPVALQDREVGRLEAFFRACRDDDWRRPTRCEGWTVRDLLAHLAAAETYHLAGIDGSVEDLMDAAAAAGVRGLDDFNRWQIEHRAGRAAGEVLDEWSGLNRAMRDGFRRLGDTGMVATTGGPYPARWQAFHVANHLALHADDLGAPVAPDEATWRRRWRVDVCLFGVSEAGWPVTVERRAGANRLTLGGAVWELGDQELVDAVTGRLPPGHPLPPEARRAAAVMA